MRPPFYRACQKHKEELQDRTPDSIGHEILWCPRGGLDGKGHRCRSWLVLDGGGETLAVAYLNEAPKLVSSELAKIDFPVAPPPEKFCKRGHFEWYLETDGRYRCRICKRDRILRKYYKDKPKPKAPFKPKKVKLKRKHKIIAPFRHGRQKFN